jgi:hypothetical protein
MPKTQTFTFHAKGQTFETQAVVSGEAMVAANRKFLDGLDAPMGVWSEIARNEYRWLEGNFYD